MLGKPEGNLQDMSWLDDLRKKTGSFWVGSSTSLEDDIQVALDG